MIVTIHHLVPDSEADLAEEADAHAALHMKVSTMMKASGAVQSTLLAVFFAALTVLETSSRPHQPA
jgi:hypothetical protein